MPETSFVSSIDLLARSAEPVELAVRDAKPRLGLPRWMKFGFGILCLWQHQLCLCLGRSWFFIVIFVIYEIDAYPLLMVWKATAAATP